MELVANLPLNDRRSWLCLAANKAAQVSPPLPLEVGFSYDFRGGVKLRIKLQPLFPKNDYIFVSEYLMINPKIKSWCKPNAKELVQFAEAQPKLLKSYYDSNNQ